MGEGLTAIPSAVLVQQYFTKHRALAVALSSQGLALGTTITGPLSRFLIEVYAWRGAMLLSACVAIQGFVCTAAMRPVPQTIVSSSNATPTNQDGVTLQGKLPKSSLAGEHQPIQLFRPLGHWADKPLSVHCSTGLRYTVVPQDTELS